jgi:hypothetical protein
MSFENFDYDKFAESMRKGGGKATLLDAKDIEGFKKGLADYTKELTKAQKGHQVFSGIVSGQQRSFLDMDDALDDLNKALEKTRNELDKEQDTLKQKQIKQKLGALEEEKVRRGVVVSWQNVGIATGNLASGLRNLTGQVLTAAFDFASGLQAGKEGAELYAQASVKAAKATGDMAKGAGDVVMGIGSLLEVLSFFLPGGAIVKALRWIGLGVTALGFGVKELTPALTEGAVKAAELFSTELTNTKTAFKDINTAGMSLADGMSGMRADAVRAGYELTTWAKIVKDNADPLSNMGMGVTRSAKMFSELSKGLLDSQLSKNLYNLGYGMKEQGDLMLFTMAQMTAAGKSEAEIRATINESTEAYGKSLKIIQDITGKDAKKALEKAADEAMDATVYAKVFSKFGEDGVEKMKAQFNLMTEADKKAYKQKIALDGATYTDIATHLRNTMSGGAIDKSFDTYYKDLANTSLKYTENYTQRVAEIQGEKLEATTSKAAMARIGVFAPGAATGKNSNAEAALAGTTEDTKLKRQLADAKAAKAIGENVNKTAENTDKLTGTVFTMDQEVRKAGAKFTELTTGPLKTFSSGLVESREYLKGFAKTLADIGIKPEKGPAGTVTVANAKRAIGGGPAAGTAAAVRGGSGTSVFGDVANALGINTVSPRSIAAAAAQAKGLRMKSAESTSGGTAKQQLIDLATQIQSQAGDDLKYFSAFNDRYHLGLDRKTSHASGTALDFVLTDPSKAAHYASIVRSMPGVKSVLNEYEKLSPGATGGHIHAEVEAMDKGGALSPGKMAIVGEKGPEIIQGPGSVTSTSHTSKTFDQMNHHLAELVRLMKTGNRTSDKLYRATA